jgi:hypothetical protein
MLQKNYANFAKTRSALIHAMASLLLSVPIGVASSLTAASVLDLPRAERDAIIYPVASVCLSTTNRIAVVCHAAEDSH